MWIIQIRIDESFIYMKKMRFLVGLLGVLLIGGIVGSGDWALPSATPETARFVDTVVAESHAEDSMPSAENFVSPIITQSAKPVKSFYRYKKERLAEFSNGVRFSFSCDFPDSSVAYAKEIREWLGKKAIDALTSDEADQRKIINDNQLERYVSGLYLSSKKEEYGNSEEDHPAVEFFELTLQSVKYSSRYVTYQELTHEYGGGAHGYYTERFISYDFVHNQEIGYHYLFKEGCEEELLKVLVDEARKDSHYQEWKPELCLSHFGLSSKGVVFSFQPYEISCFAAGTFHIIVPYKRLKPFLSDKAKWCIG